jgi:general secretion pathway protein A
MYGIQRRKGIMVLTGEIGTGKTTICRTLLNSFDDTIKTALILNPCFNEVQLLQLIIRDLGIDCTSDDKMILVSVLNDFLLKETAQGHNVVLIIDEAQNLEVPQLEQIRLLSNLETEKEKLLQIVLIGQPELFDKLKLPDLRQLNQRVTVRYHILPLEKEELPGYVNHRLKVAGAPETLRFTPEAYESIFTHSQGTPRLVNILCDRALLAGFVEETYTICDKIIHRSAREIR